MENQTRFNLSAAVESWRQELAAEPDLTPQVRRELETHLDDTMAEFRRRGLSEEDAFWLARRRVGRPRPLAEEFLKANPEAVWRERVMWMAIALLVVSLWDTTLGIICQLSLFSSSSRYVHWLGDRQFFFQSLFYPLLRLAPILAVVGFLLRCRFRAFSKLAVFFQTRSRFLISMIGWLSINEGFRFNVMYLRGPVEYAWANLFSASVWPVALIILIALLMGPQGQVGLRKEDGIYRILTALILGFPALTLFGMGDTGFLQLTLLVKVMLGAALPAVLLALVKSGVLNHQKLVGLRAYVIVWNLILGAVLTTPEVVTQVITAAVLQAVFELGVWMTRHWESRLMSPN